MNSGTGWYLFLVEISIRHLLMTMKCSAGDMSIPMYIRFLWKFVGLARIAPADS